MGDCHRKSIQGEDHPKVSSKKKKNAPKQQEREKQTPNKGKNSSRFGGPQTCQPNARKKLHPTKEKTWEGGMIVCANGDS